MIRNASIKYLSFVLSSSLLVHAATAQEPIEPLGHSAKELQQVKEMIVAIHESISATLSITISMIKKFGKKLEHKDDGIKTLQTLKEIFEDFLQRKTRPIRHYFQQEVTTIPAEAYPEIYGIHDAILTETMKLLDGLNAYIRNDFEESFDYNYLVSKDTLIIDEHVTASALIEHGKKTLQKVDELWQSGNTIGLTLWNKMCRKIDRFFVQPCARYHIPEVAGITFAATVGAAYIFWITYCEKLQVREEKIAEDNQKKHTEGMNLNSFQPIYVDKSELRDPKATTVNKDGDSFFRRLVKIMQFWLGKVPAAGKGSLWTVSDDEVVGGGQRTVWNSTVAAIHNLFSPDPLAAIFQAGAASFCTTYAVGKAWPIAKYSIQNWWQESLGGSYAEMKPHGTWEIPATITFDHVIGLQHIKDQLTPALEYAADPSKYINIGDKIPTNYIFYGLKRTGKSYFANALAGEMQVRNGKIRILNIPCAAFRELGVQQVIDMIRSYAPCIAFIDEVDIAGFSRAMDRNTTGDLLKALGDGNISPSPERPVFLIFATNKLESIDTSLTSFGRFGASILFTTPSFYDRIQFIIAILQSTGQNPNNFDVQRLAEKTEGESFESIKYCVTKAIFKVINDKCSLSTELILEQMNEILHGLYPQYPYELNPETIEVLATHFAGQALISILAPSNEMLDTVSICKRKLPLIEDEYAGYSGKPTRQPKYQYGALLTRQATITENIMGPKTFKTYIMRLVAGTVAEEMILGECTNSCDYKSMQSAYEAVLLKCSDGGVVYYLDQFVSNEHKAQFFTKTQEFITACKEEVRALLTEHRKAFEVTIRALRMLGTITDGLVAAIKENPDAINEKLDEEEQRRAKQLEEYVAAQEKAAVPVPAA